MRTFGLQIRKLAIVVLPFALGWDGLDRIPMLDNLFIGDAKQIKKGCVDAVPISLTDRQAKVSLGQNSVIRLVLNAMYNCRRRIILVFFSSRYL